MHVQVDYDAAERVWTVVANEGRLRTADDVGAWARELEGALEASVPAGVDLLVSIEGIDIDMTARDAFTEVVRAIARRHGKTILYGRGAGFTSTVLLLVQLHQGATVRVCADRSAALRALQKARRSPQGDARGGAVAKG